jgi:hypothetical protein
MDQTQPLRTGDRLEAYPTLLCLAWFSAARRARKLYICQTLREHRDLRASFSPSWKRAELKVKMWAQESGARKARTESTEFTETSH